MSENVFFNPGQAIASDFDFNKAYVAAQIYHHKAQKPVLVVQEKDGQPFVIFDEQAALASEKEEAKRYSLVKRVTESD
ncbi:hypothetical protein [Ligilactobacillus agilis]|uniref:hypothetical protein n=1 Tax=Ligilactobacillus agilis TaxID=1601 RepID=UPI00255C7BE6|nr:hypothetical protein [Ligilactobacillus agilis]